MNEQMKLSFSRLAALPMEVFLVPVEAKSDSRDAVPLQAVFDTWQLTSKRFVWRADEIGEAADLIAATIASILFNEPFPSLQPIYNTDDLAACIYKVRFRKTGQEGYLPIQNMLGYFLLKEPDSIMNKAYFFLYIGEYKVVSRTKRPVSLYQHFQQVYAGIADGDPELSRKFDAHFGRYKPKRFASLANRSINRRRHVDLRTRIRILDRDHRTCQGCGRKAPDVILVVDHRTPVEEGGDNTDANLWTLCEDCNLGKSDLPFFRT